MIKICANCIYCSFAGTSCLQSEEDKEIDWDNPACNVGKRVSDHIGRISFTGCIDTIDFVPANVFLNVKAWKGKAKE